MTRMEKYASKRRVIELENTLFYMTNPQKWLRIVRSQRLIKLVIGAKH